MQPPESQCGAEELTQESQNDFSPKVYYMPCLISCNSREENNHFSFFLNCSQVLRIQLHFPPFHSLDTTVIMTGLFFSIILLLICMVMFYIAN